MESMRVTVVGKSSLIAQALQAHPAGAGWQFISHLQARQTHEWLDHTDLIINCAFDDRLKQEPYQPELDMDLWLAEQLRERPHIRYTMLSSRMAYGAPPPDGRLHTDLQSQPINLYGQAKWRTEQTLRELLGPRLLILRLSNIFGQEDVPGRRNFFAMALRSLREQGRIVLDISPFVERDFLPVDQLAQSLVHISQLWKSGLFNLGSGHGVPTGRIAQWLIEGHGRGELLINNLREHDAFWLDMSVTRQTFGILPTPPELIRER
ncbi:MAG TPA: sugar nucleotide-binding protein, partial [Aquabacterium sp.]|nr:sugar nucleotide-binding protein [Aquabacterium sp.]